jgi:hypothetical protein
MYPRFSLVLFNPEDERSYILRMSVTVYQSTWRTNPEVLNLKNKISFINENARDFV